MKYHFTESTINSKQSERKDESGMMDEKMNKNGILIHQLPLSCVEEVLGYFPEGCIFYYFHNIQGLHLYFHDPDRMTECVNYRNIRVQEQTFNIYLKVTNLTVHEIATYIGDVKEFLQSGFRNIIDLYPVYGIEENDRHKSCIIKPDYRVILNVPEILYDTILRPIPWPERPGFSFRVSFYCRLCHKNGHKTLACETHFKKESSDSDLIINRSIPHEGSSSDLRDQNMKHSEPPNKAADFHDHNTFRTCSHSAVSDSSHFHVSVRKIEPYLNMTDNTPECTGGQTEPGTSNSQPKLQRKVSLSEGIKEAIAKSKKSDRVLPPNSLIKLLNSVRRRKSKKLMEITLTYTPNIFGLIHQLQLVKETYYLLGKIRSEDEERDINFLENLQNRLEEQISKQTEANNLQEQPSSSSFVREGSRSNLASTGLWSSSSSDSD